jgi:hypothetical protein
MPLILKRASASRPSGELCDGDTMCSLTASSSGASTKTRELRWFWSISTQAAQEWLIFRAEPVRRHSVDDTAPDLRRP